MAFCWLGGRHRRYRNMVQRHLNSHVKEQGAFRTISRRYKEMIVCGQFPKKYALLDSAAAV